MPDTIVMPHRPQMPLPARSLDRDDCTELVARTLYKADALTRNNPDLPWEQAHHLDQARYRQVARVAVALANRVVPRVAAMNAKRWIIEKLRNDHDGDYPTFNGGAFADQLIGEAVDYAYEEFEHEIQKAAREARR